MPVRGNPGSGEASILDKKFPGHGSQTLHRFFIDEDAFRGFQPPVILPESGHEVKGHALPQYRPVSPSQTHGALSPVGGIAEADGIAGAAILDDAVFLENIKKARATSSQVFPGLACSSPASMHRPVRFQKNRRRNAQENRS